MNKIFFYAGGVMPSVNGIDLDDVMHTNGYNKAVELLHSTLTSDRTFLYYTTNPMFLDHATKLDNIMFYNYKDRTWVSIRSLTEKELRPAHCISRMYVNGAFDLPKIGAKL